MKSKKYILYSVIVALLAIIIGWLIHLNSIMRSRFEGKRWRIPSTVYSRSLELYEGVPLDIDMFIRELTEASYIRKANIEIPGDFSKRGSTFRIYRRSFTFSDGFEQESVFTIEVKNGRVHRLLKKDEPTPLIRIDPIALDKIYPDSLEDRKLVKLSEVPTPLVDALLATEDQDFYNHWGINFKSIFRAMLANIKAGSVVQGGSTLTQQLAKNFYLTSERSIKRKIVEAIFAVFLELHYDKEQILETYINEVYFGQNGANAIHGFGLASEHYFGKSLKQLDLSQMALLVAVVNGPSYYNPHRFPDRCLKRRNLILNILFKRGNIDDDMYQEAISSPLKLRPIYRKRLGRYPAYIDLVKRHLARDYKLEDLQEEGLRIFTSFDPQTQWAVEEAIEKQISRWKRRDRSLEASAVISSINGEVEAVVGGKTPGYPGFNRALDSKRSIGSLIKPVVLLAAFEEDKSYTLNTKLDDSSIEVELPGQKSWRPKNFDKKDHGYPPIYKVLANSYNQATVGLGLDIGIDSVVEALKRLGVSENIHKNPSLLLGSLGLSPLEVVKVYQIFASNGFASPIKAVREVQTQGGKTIKSYHLEVRKLFDPAVIHLLNYALQAVMREGTGKSALSHFPSNMYLAGKTGTSNDYRDSWFAGFSGDKVGVVWVGRDDNKPTFLTGGSGALQIWARFMKKVSSQPISAKIPNGVEYFWIDESDGGVSSSYCQGVRYMPFIKGTQPENSAHCIKSLQPIVDWFRNLFQKGDSK